eukprot:CAMPEP_0176497074 /NCGR_PEP_ID=MMETSP0200_2-20121128/11527_1 /TAXON_ID=947934 /ORGANISM="Chaetoceros sp., Strain GSL56" /LENGTH=353 /DNA_ID=CAMNT_0017895057 /DNA_START=111 /DNA_END=1172 /DNA_ORIENTATION=-
MSDTHTDGPKGEIHTQQQQQKECQTCIKHLLSTLQSPNSKPMALFHAMGVDVASYKLNTNGIMVEIPQQTTLSKMSTIPTQSSSVETTGFGGERHVQSKSHESSDNSTTMMTKLKNRLTKRFLQEPNRYSINTNSDDNTSTTSSIESPPNPIRSPATVATSAITKPSPIPIPSPISSPPPMELQITCQKCGNDGPEGGARAFVKGPNPLSIVLCSNRLSTQEEINEVLVHELIHVYDVHHRKWDLTNCYTLAKSEVRAAREAECANATMSFTKRYCAKEKARVATKNMFPDVGLQCVAAVFEEAMVDKAPFGGGEGKGWDGGGGGGIRKDGDLYAFPGGRSFESSYPSDGRDT